MATKPQTTKDLLQASSPHNTRMVPDAGQSITREELLKAMPKGVSATVTDDILTMINSMGDSVNLPQELLEEDLMSYMHLLGGRGRSIKDLVNAIKFCNLKRNMGVNKAWSIVFPAKYKELVDAQKGTSNFSSMYNGSPLVCEIDKAMILPVSLMYQHQFHMAVKKDIDLMNGISAPNADGEMQTVSPHVQHLAAANLMTVLRMPEEQSVELKIGASDAVMAQQQEMVDHIGSLVAMQAKAFREGKDIQELQKVHVKLVEEPVIDAEVTDESN